MSLAKLHLIELLEFGWVSPVNKSTGTSRRPKSDRMLSWAALWTTHRRITLKTVSILYKYNDLSCTDCCPGCPNLTTWTGGSDLPHTQALAIDHRIYTYASMMVGLVARVIAPPTPPSPLKERYCTLHYLWNK